MNDTLHVAIFQFDIVWRSISANLDKIDHKIQNLSRPIDLLVLPEMFTTGFCMDPNGVSEEMDGPTLSKMKKWAHDISGAVAGSLIIKEGDHFYNRFVFVEPDGIVQFYDKRHLFSLAGESDHYSSGHQRPVWEFRDWRICPQICYDLRFPVWSRNTAEYDVLLYVASWPKPRHSAWGKLLQARAIENQCFVVGANRCGLDGNNYEYHGGSMLIDYMGDVQSKAEESESLIYQEFNKYDKDTFISKYPFLEDRDSFTLIDR